MAATPSTMSEYFTLFYIIDYDCDYCYYYPGYNPLYSLGLLKKETFMVEYVTKCAYTTPRYVIFHLCLY